MPIDKHSNFWEKKRRFSIYDSHHMLLSGLSSKEMASSKPDIIVNGDVTSPTIPKKRLQRKSMTFVRGSTHASSLQQKFEQSNELYDPPLSRDNSYKRFDASPRDRRHQTWSLNTPGDQGEDDDDTSEDRFGKQVLKADGKQQEAVHSDSEDDIRQQASNKVLPDLKLLQKHYNSGLKPKAASANNFMTAPASEDGKDSSPDRANPSSRNQFLGVSRVGMRRASVLPEIKEEKGHSMNNTFNEDSDIPHSHDTSKNPSHQEVPEPKKASLSFNQRLQELMKKPSEERHPQLTQDTEQQQPTSTESVLSPDTYSQSQTERSDKSYDETEEDRFYAKTTKPRQRRVSFRDEQVGLSQRSQSDPAEKPSSQSQKTSRRGSVSFGETVVLGGEQIVKTKKKSAKEKRKDVDRGNDDINKDLEQANTYIRILERKVRGMSNEMFALTRRLAFFEQGMIDALDKVDELNQKFDQQESRKPANDTLNKFVISKPSVLSSGRRASAMITQSPRLFERNEGFLDPEEFLKDSPKYTSEQRSQLSTLQQFNIPSRQRPISSSKNLSLTDTEGD